MKSILKEYNNYTYFIGKPIRLFAKMGMSKKDFIEQFQCNYNNGTAEVITNQPGSLNYYCQKMPAIKSFQATGHCYTFFHSAAFGGLEQNMNWTDWSVIEEENNEEDCDIGFMNVCRCNHTYQLNALNPEFSNCFQIQASIDSTPKKSYECESTFIPKRTRQSQLN